MAVPVKIIGIKKSDDHGAISRDVYVHVASDLAEFEMDVRIPTHPHEADEMEHLRRELHAFSLELATALERPLQFH
jgi:hypothetical protein